MRSIATSICTSPMPVTISSCVSSLRSHLDRRIVVGHAVQALAQLVLVALVLRRHRERHHRVREDDRPPSSPACPTAHSVSFRPVAFSFASATMSPACASGTVSCFLPFRKYTVPMRSFCSLVALKISLFGLQRAAPDARHRQLPHERVVDRPPHLRHQRRLRGRIHGVARRVLRRPVRRARHQPRKTGHQFVEADRLARHHREDRNELRLRHGGAQSARQLVGRQRLAAEHLLDQRVAGFRRHVRQARADRVRLRRPGRRARPPRPSCRPAGNVTTSHRAPQRSCRAATVPSKSAFSLSRPVIAIARGRPSASQRFHARIVPTCMPAVASTAISAASATLRRRHHLPVEIRIARRVQHHQPQRLPALRAPHRIERLRPDRDLAVLLLVGPVRHAGAVAGIPQPVVHPQLVEQGIHQRRLAAARVAHQNEIPHIRDRDVLHMLFAFPSHVVSKSAGRETRPQNCAPYTKERPAATAK